MDQSLEMQTAMTGGARWLTLFCLATAGLGSLLNALLMH